MGPFITFIAFDLETTGLDPQKDEIIEIAGVKFSFERQGAKLITKRIGEFASLVKPNRFIPEAATRVNNITNQMVEHAPDLKSVVTQFIRFCGLSSILVAHNASFDSGFLCKGLKSSGHMMPQIPILDSLKVTRKLLPESSSHRLGDLAKKLADQIVLQVARDQLHRALYDCEVLKEIFGLCLRKRFQEKDLAMNTALASLEKIHGPAIRFEHFFK